MSKIFLSLAFATLFLLLLVSCATPDESSSKESETESVSESTSESFSESESRSEQSSESRFEEDSEIVSPDEEFGGVLS